MLNAASRYCGYTLYCGYVATVRMGIDVFYGKGATILSQYIRMHDEV